MIGIIPFVCMTEVFHIVETVSDVMRATLERNFYVTIGKEVNEIGCEV
jgi:hypothetical protein